MSLKDVTLTNANTAVVTTGGTSHHMIADSQPVVNGFHLTDVTEANFLDKVQMTCKSKNPILDVRTGLVSKSKREIIISIPKLDAQDNYKYSSLRIGTDVLASEPQLVDDLISYGLQLFTDPDFIAFLRNGV